MIAVNVRSKKIDEVTHNCNIQIPELSLMVFANQNISSFYQF